jgi:hypothetical protein
MNEVTPNHYNQINKAVVKKMKNNSTNFTKTKKSNQNQEPKKQIIRLKKTSSDNLDYKSSPFKFSKNSLSKTLSSKRFMMNEISFNEQLIDTDVFDEGVKEIFQRMMNNMKIIKDTINESDRITQGYKKESFNKEAFDMIILTKDEKKHIIEDIISESNQRYHNYEEQINTIMENLSQINSIYYQYKDKINKTKERAISTLDTIESQFKEDNIILSANPKDDIKFNTINSKPRKSMNPTLSYSETNPNLGKTFVTNNKKKPLSFSKNNSKNTNSYNTRNPIISLNTTINNNYSSTLSSIPGSTKMCKQGYLSVDKKNNVSSNMLTMKVHTQSDLNFTINNTITEENQTPGTKVTSRYEESEIEEYTGEKQLNFLIYKKNNLADKDLSPFAKKHYKTPSLIPIIDDTTFEHDVIDSNGMKKRTFQYSHHNEAILLTKFEDENQLHSR